MVGSTIDGLSGGIYEATIIDDNGCTTSIEVTITEPEALSVVSTITNTTCSDTFDGGIDLAVEGGSAPYEITLADGSEFIPGSGFSPGDYEITVTDANNCSVMITATVGSPDPITIDAVVTQINCRGNNNGQIDLSITGGTPDYSIEWSNGTTGLSIDQLGAGIYAATVTDANGCAAEVSYEILEPSSSLMGFANTMIMEDCKRELVGMVRASAVGGTPPYTYEWSKGATGNVVNDLPAGSYDVTITDAVGCSVVESFTLDIEQLPTPGGRIGPDQIVCGRGADADVIDNIELPLGSNSAKHFEYKWMRSTRPCTMLQLNVRRSWLGSNPWS